MRSIAGDMPKELLSVAGEPVLGHVLGECAQSGIDEVLVVVSPGKDAIGAYVKAVVGAPGMPARIDIAIQVEARGLADAVRVGRDFAGARPVAIALPDNLFVDAPQPALAQVIETFARAEKHVVGLTEITAETAARRGPTPIYAGTRHGDDFAIESIPSKGAHGSTFSLGSARSAMTGVGRYVFAPDAFDVIDSVERSLASGMELDDIPVMQAMLARGDLVGRVLQGTFLDVGLPEGYREATARVQGF